MKPAALVILLAVLTVPACSSGRVTFSAPDKDAPVWDLNQGRQRGTNDLVRETNLNGGSY